jgi:hypothetical protein
MYEKTSHWTVQQPKLPRHPALSALDGLVCKASATAENTPSANNRPSPIAKERTCCMRSLTVVCVRAAYWLPVAGAIVGPGKQHGSTAGQSVVSASSQECMQHVPALPDYLNLLSRLNARNSPHLQNRHVRLPAGRYLLHPKALTDSHPLAETVQIAHPAG